MNSDGLVHDSDAVAALSVTVAERTGVPAEHVEKDFWVTEVLRGVVTAADDLGVEVVFKGGTSLSKAFSLIERFSEDVDVLVVLSPQDSTGARDRTLKALVAGAADATMLEPVGVPGATSKGAKRGGPVPLPARRDRECRWPVRRGVPRARLPRRCAPSHPASGLVTACRVRR